MQTFVCHPANFSGKMLTIFLHRCWSSSLSPQFLLLDLRRLSKALDVGKFFKSSAQNSESNFGERVSSCGNFWEWLIVCRSWGVFDALVLDLSDKCSLQNPFLHRFFWINYSKSPGCGTADESHTDMILSGQKMGFKHFIQKNILGTIKKVRFFKR